MNTSGEYNELPLPDGELTWSVLHAKPRCEKKIAEFCRSRRYQVFLPLFTRKHEYGARKRSYEVPLFPGYVFAYLDPRGRSLLKGSNYVANLLIVHEQETLVFQLNQIRKALSSQVAVELMPEFKTGMKVELKYGPMKGVEGIIERVKKNTRIILNVDFIKQSIAMEVDADWLIPR